MGWLGSLGLIGAGVAGLLYAFANMNWDAPQASDWGNNFVWPSVGAICLGVVILLWQIIWAFVPGMSE